MRETEMLERGGQTKKKEVLKEMCNKLILKAADLRLQGEQDQTLLVIREDSKHQAISMDRQEDQKHLPKQVQ